MFSFIFEGNLAADPELRETKTGVPVAQLRVGYNNRYQRNGQWVQGETVWINVSAWRGLSERVTQSLRKGDTVVVELGDIRVTPFGLQGSARTIALSMRFTNAISTRTDTRAGQEHAGFHEVAVTGGYTTGSEAGYVDTTTGEIHDQADPADPADPDQQRPEQADHHEAATRPRGGRTRKQELVEA